MAGPGAVPQREALPKTGKRVPLVPEWESRRKYIIFHLLIPIYVRAIVPIWDFTSVYASVPLSWSWTVMPLFISSLENVS
jgi:hypothetical protein